MAKLISLICSLLTQIIYWMTFRIIKRNYCDKKTIICWHIPENISHLHSDTTDHVIFIECNNITNADILIRFRNSVTAKKENIHYCQNIIRAIKRKDYNNKKSPHSQLLYIFNEYRLFVSWSSLFTAVLHQQDSLKWL